MVKATKIFSLLIFLLFLLVVYLARVSVTASSQCWGCYSQKVMHYTLLLTAGGDNNWSKLSSSCRDVRVVVLLCILGCTTTLVVFGLSVLCLLSIHGMTLVCLCLVTWYPHKNKVPALPTLSRAERQQLKSQLSPAGAGSSHSHSYTGVVASEFLLVHDNVWSHLTGLCRLRTKEMISLTGPSGRLT